MVTFSWSFKEDLLCFSGFPFNVSCACQPCSLMFTTSSTCFRFFLSKASSISSSKGIVTGYLNYLKCSKTLHTTVWHWTLVCLFNAYQNARHTHQFQRRTFAVMCYYEWTQIRDKESFFILTKHCVCCVSLLNTLKYFEIQPSAP